MIRQIIAREAGPAALRVFDDPERRNAVSLEGIAGAYAATIGAEGELEQ